MTEISGATAIVTGASSGFGRATAEALIHGGARVIGVARGRTRLDDTRSQLGGDFVVEAGDAAEAGTASRLIEQYRPQIVVLCAGAAPPMRPLQAHTWESFSTNWNADVRQVFGWTQAALTTPLETGSRVIALSSGAAVKGSPLSGGYAGAKATIRLIASYAADESERAGLGIGFMSILPQLTPATPLGADAVAAYAERQGVSVDAYLESFGPTLAAEQVGARVVELVAASATRGAYLLTAQALTPLP